MQVKTLNIEINRYKNERELYIQKLSSDHSKEINEIKMSLISDVNLI